MIIFSNKSKLQNDSTIYHSSQTITTLRKKSISFLMSTCNICGLHTHTHLGMPSIKLGDIKYEEYH